MSHITHLYHLSALDFINTSSFPNMSPWLPSYTASDMIAGSSTLGTALVTHYVEALGARRKMHTAGALFSGRQPIQNALVPGGVTTLFSTTYPLSPSTTIPDYDQFGPFNATDTRATFKSLLTNVRTFINTRYIPDVVTVANQFSTYFTQGVGCGNLLAYGDYPTNASGGLFTKRGLALGVGAGSGLVAFDQQNIVEYVDYSWYDYGILDAPALHPFDGKTTVNKAAGQSYSWLKAPRYVTGTGTIVCEVGPLARMVVTHLSGANQVNVTEADMPVGTSLGEVLGGSALASYNASNLVTTALTLVGSAPLTALWSSLGRHAARALEAKYIADAMAGTSGSITSWVDQLVPDAQCYTYKRIPKQIAAGYGLCEAPRGALGHWIKIEGRKVAKYQCVVPSTWNFSPKDGLGQAGPVEDALIGSDIGPTATDQIVNILRIVHPFDCCIACAVHVVSPDGKEKLKFAIGPDGRPTNVEIAE